MLNIFKKKVENDNTTSEKARNSITTDKNIYKTTFSNKELLFTLKEDGIQLTKEEIQKLSNGNDDEKLFFDIAEKYREKKNYSKSLAWYHKVQSYHPAQNMIGWMYQNGFGLSKEYHQAMYWYLKAANNGNANAQNNIGKLYEKGLGVTTDYNQAMAWYLKAHANGKKIAAANIGYLYRHGLGVPANSHIGNEWLTKSAIQGDVTAQFALAFSFEHDEVFKDLQKSVNWYKKAADNGDEDAKEALRDLIKDGYFPEG